jgi:hypothetical protein
MEIPKQRKTHSNAFAKSFVIVASTSIEVVTGNDRDAANATQKALYVADTSKIFLGPMP